MNTQAQARMILDIMLRLGADEDPTVLEDVAVYGADSGFGGFTYTAECVEFYDAHSSAIWEMLIEDAEDFGYPNPIAFVASFNRDDMLADEDSFKNLLAWYALEQVARDLVDEGEEA